MLISEILNELKLGNSVAESDERLDRYFVNTPTYNALINGRKDIIAGDKGTGKTALYRILAKRAGGLDNLRSVKIITAFNPTGNPVFQELNNVGAQTEARYIGLWKTYLLALIGNWLLDQPRLLRTSSRNRVEYLLDKGHLRTADTSPKGVFSKIVALFPRRAIKSVELDFSIEENGLPKIGPKVEFADPIPGTAQTFFGVDYENGLRIIEAVLAESNLTVWVALDRLDEAFQGFGKVEIPALRALLRTYLDMHEFRNVCLKLFLRKDLFRKIVASGTAGFVNLTHVNDAKIEIIWEEEDLLYLLVARIKDNESLMKKLHFTRLSDEEMFEKFFPVKVSQGKKQSMTWKWILARIEDENGIIAPRNLIDLVERAREAQLRADGRGQPREFVDGQSIFESDAIRSAHKQLSIARLEDTLYAEAPDLLANIEKFRNKKAEHTKGTICALCGVTGDGADTLIRKLSEIGFLRKVGDSYKIPMLYRDGLGIIQGKANGLEAEKLT